MESRKMVLMDSFCQAAVVMQTESRHVDPAGEGGGEWGGVHGNTYTTIRETDSRRELLREAGAQTRGSVMSWSVGWGGRGQGGSRGRGRPYTCG